MKKKKINNNVLKYFQIENKIDNRYLPAASAYIKKVILICESKMINREQNCFLTVHYAYYHTYTYTARECIFHRQHGVHVGTYTASIKLTSRGI